MKKAAILFIALLMCFALASCKKTGDDNSSEETSSTGKSAAEIAGVEEDIAGISDAMKDREYPADSE